MSRTELFARLFEYDGWANRRVLEILSGLSNPPQKSVDRMAHVVRAGELWLSRLGAGEWPKDRAVFPKGASLASVRAEAELLSARWAQYCRTLHDSALDEVIAYASTEGSPFTTRAEDILLHVSHHGAYHRGQVPLDVKAAGFEVPPFATDFVFFVRQQAV